MYNSNKNFKYDNWYKVCKFEKLNENLIYELHKKVFLNWYFIFKYQKINFSKNFILQFINKMNCYTLYDIDEKNYYSNDIIHDYGFNEKDLLISKKLINKLKQRVIIKYTIYKLGDIGILINNFI